MTTAILIVMALGVLATWAWAIVGLLWVAAAENSNVEVDDDDPNEKRKDEK